MLPIVTHKSIQIYFLLFLAFLLFLVFLFSSSSSDHVLVYDNSHSNNNETHR